MLPTFDIFGIEIPTYGLISVVGMFAAIFVGLIISKNKVDKYDLLMTTIVAGVGLFIGAHLLYSLTRIDDIADAFANYGEFGSFWEFLKYITGLMGGMVFYGGLYGGLAAGFLFARKKKYDVAKLSDVFAVVVPLFHAFGRVGCFFAGCCYGVESRWGIAGRVLYADVRETVRRVPIQLIEALCLLVLFGVMFWLYRKCKAQGKLIFIYLMIYAMLRFILEFFRGDEIRGRFMIFSTSQWISIVTLVWVTVYLIYRKIKGAKTTS